MTLPYKVKTQADILQLSEQLKMEKGSSFQLISHTVIRYFKRFPRSGNSEVRIFRKKMTLGIQLAKQIPVKIMGNTI